MADTDPIAIVQLSPADASAGLALSTEARWNQNEADWRFFLTKGTVFGVRVKGGHLVATAALLPYTSCNAWISMVLVTASSRRRGLATKLVDTCLEAAAGKRLTTWLDATPQGAAVYGPLGFVPTLQLRRLRLAHSASAKNAAPKPTSTSDADEFIARDIGVMGFDRTALLAELGGRPSSRFLSRGNAVALVRDGRKARHIGPMFANSPDQALSLVNEIAQSEAGPLLVDVVSTQTEFVDGLINSGWTIERPFQRMRLGRSTAMSSELPFAVAGPEYG
jgi:GNAT superfamily N-acetyltransferase